jgi:hypothetical protein
MKKNFLKFVSFMIIIGAISAVSNFCVEMWFGPSLNISVAPKIIESSQEAIAFHGVCSGMGNLVAQAPSVAQAPYQVSQARPIQSDSAAMPCCLDSSGHISASVLSQQFNFSNIFAVVFHSSDYSLPLINKEELLNQPILSPPEQLALSTTNLRI